MLFRFCFISNINFLKNIYGELAFLRFASSNLVLKMSWRYFPSHSKFLFAFRLSFSCLNQSFPSSLHQEVLYFVTKLYLVLEPERIRNLFSSEKIVRVVISALQFSDLCEEIFCLKKKTLTRSEIQTNFVLQLTRFVSFTKTIQYPEY